MTLPTLSMLDLVDDDPLFRETLSGNLEDAGYRVRCWSDGQTFLAAQPDLDPSDLILLDWKMPGLSGIDVLRSLRQSGSATPVVFLTVLSDQIFEEAALMGGAVDFIEKSRSFAIVEKRIRLILGRGQSYTRTAGDADDRVKVGSLTLDPDSKRAYWLGRLVELTLSEFAMVQVLAANEGRDIGYRALYDAGKSKGFHAGAGDDGYRTNVRAAIKRLREKFKALDPNFSQIENYPGFGYVWRTDDDG
jgi:two-component system response regulator ChvI